MKTLVEEDDEAIRKSRERRKAIMEKYKQPTSPTIVTKLRYL
jgi:hypothetical protein